MLINTLMPYRMVFVYLSNFCSMQKEKLHYAIHIFLYKGHIYLQTPNLFCHQ